MTTRRTFLITSAGAGILGALGADNAAAIDTVASTLSRPRTRGAHRALRVLILGGTGFVGPHLVHLLVQGGHQVALLNRGRREPGLFGAAFDNVERLTGDRAAADGYAALRGRTWDVVIETSGYRHDWTRAAVDELRETAARYVYISSTGVFWPYHEAGLDEDGRVLLADTPVQDPPSYGVMKALSENHVRDGFGSRALVVRPGYIVGPGDTSDRWTYWPVRIHRGGEILVPGRTTDPVQYIDVRDLTEWIVRMIEAEQGGTFNVVGPARRQTMSEFVHGVAATTSVPLSWTWIEDYEWLRQFPLRTAADGTTSGLVYAVPWIMADGDELGHMQVDGRRAIAAGLTFRPLAETARDTVAWRASDLVPAALREQPRYVLSPADEARILDAWKSR